MMKIGDWRKEMEKMMQDELRLGDDINRQRVAEDEGDANRKTNLS